MSKYRSRPVIIDAWQVGSDERPHWVDVELSQGNLEHVNNQRRWLIHSNEHVIDGMLEASGSDWIIRGLKGDLYPCNDKIFKMKYEPLGEK